MTRRAGRLTSYAREPPGGGGAELGDGTWGSTARHSTTFMQGPNMPSTTEHRMTCLCLCSATLPQPFLPLASQLLGTTLTCFHAAL